MTMVLGVSMTFVAVATAQTAAPPAPAGFSMNADVTPAGTATPAPKESMGRSASRMPYTGAKEIHWFRDSAEYRACAIQAFEWAGRLAEENARGMTSGTWCIITDADETVLDNSLFQKEVGSEGYTPEKWDAWVKREEAVATPGAVKFLDRVHQLGGRVVIISNRKASEKEHTEAALRKSGLSYDLFLGQTTTATKEGRFESVENGTAAPGMPPMKVVLWCGDNIQDFPGKRQEIRLQGEDAMAEFGRRFVVLPNPMYGTWVNNPER
jgi:5'-nucleotidase (lipoprotein e(P4) family)